MGRAVPFKADQPYLGPDGLRIAGQAYEAALHAVNEELWSFPPHRLRRVIARCVIRAALKGHRDPQRLRDRAVALLKRVAKRSRERRKGVVEEIGARETQELAS
jgi:hypothetical protein